MLPSAARVRVWCRVVTRVCRGARVCVVSVRMRLCVAGASGVSRLSRVFVVSYGFSKQAGDVTFGVDPKYARHERERRVSSIMWITIRNRERET